MNAVALDPYSLPAGPLQCPECGCTDLLWAADHFAWTHIYHVVVDEYRSVDFTWSESMNYDEQHQGLAAIYCDACRARVAVEVELPGETGGEGDVKMLTADRAASLPQAVFAAALCDPRPATSTNEIRKVLEAGGLSPEDALELASVLTGVATFTDELPGESRSRQVVAQLLQTLADKFN